jgi:hypothetical protein
MANIKKELQQTTVKMRQEVETAQQAAAEARASAEAMSQAAIEAGAHRGMQAPLHP